MYGEMKLALIIYLWYPKTKGTWYVYEAMLRPFVERHETDIERSLKELRAKAWDVAIYYWHNSTELGQTKFFEIFHYLVSRPSTPLVMENHQNSGDGRPPPPPVNPASFFRSEQADERWEPTAPPLPNTSRHQPVYAEELHLPASPSRSGSSSGHREPAIEGCGYETEDGGPEAVEDGGWMGLRGGGHRLKISPGRLFDKAVPNGDFIAGIGGRFGGVDDGWWGWEDVSERGIASGSKSTEEEEDVAVVVVVVEEEEKRSWNLVGVPMEFRRRRMEIGGVVESSAAAMAEDEIEKVEKKRGVYI
ncbi:TB2/DP1/HVA22-related protein [Cynara cardunculus var. scolymus]|uniref:TB2/DP1/HVA22-related protein n=1 Tax=Cynara cardunculus var. scolymus TaxID=59895 RepID=A0A124SBH0_CYNCS|nr:TB2/DP1/HVA22-related protein [Cynara cardunculus var. scolymus]